MNSTTAINNIHELLSTDGTTMDPAVACIITDALIQIEDNIAFLSDEETCSKHPIVSSNAFDSANTQIKEIYQALSTGCPSQDSGVAYMIKEELAKIEVYLDFLSNQQVSSECPEVCAIKHVDNDVFAFGPPGLSRSASVCPEPIMFDSDDNLCRETSHGYRRDDYGWNYTPEWAQAMSDSKHTERIKRARDQAYMKKCDEADVCYDFNCYQCLFFTCAGKAHTKIEFDEEEIDDIVTKFMYDKTGCPEFRDYVNRYGYEYLGKGPSGIAKRLADIQDAWNMSATESFDEFGPITDDKIPE